MVAVILFILFYLLVWILFDFTSNKFCNKTTFFLCLFVIIFTGIAVTADKENLGTVEQTISYEPIEYIGESGQKVDVGIWTTDHYYNDALYPIFTFENIRKKDMSPKQTIVVSDGTFQNEFVIKTEK